LKELWRKGTALWAEFSDIKAGTYASSVAYFGFLSLIPLIALCISLVSLVGIGESEVAEFFTMLVPDALADFVRTLVNDAFSRSGIALSVSTITLIWSASQGTRALHVSLTEAYGTEETRNPIVVTVICIVAAIIMGALLALSICLVFGGPVMRAIADAVPGLEQQGDILNAFNFAIMAAICIVALCTCYTFLPAGSRRFTAQLPGAVLASLACGALTIGFHIYVDNFCNYEALYGSIATVALLLFWMYLIAFILIACAFLNRYLEHMKSNRQIG